MPKFSDQTANMNDVFKTHPRPEVMKDFINSSRLQARKILHESMPASILRLQSLITQESDPSSPLWVGQVDQGFYLADNLRLYQPGQIIPGTSVKQVVGPNDMKGVLTQVGLDGDLGLGKEVQADMQDGLISRGSGDGVVDLDQPTSVVTTEVQGVDMKQKVGVHWFEIFPRNANQEEVMKLVRVEAETLMILLNDLRVWLSLETPIIEDGNSFGADVQSHISDQIDKAFNKAASYMNGCKRHHDDRCKEVRNWVTMPNLADYPAIIAGSDRIDHVLARGYLRNMLIIYGGLMSKLEKNWGKVISPKGSGGGGDAMY